MRSSQAWNEGGTDVLLASYERKEIEIVHFLDVYNRTGQPELLCLFGTTSEASLLGIRSIPTIIFPALTPNKYGDTVMSGHCAF